MEALPTYTDLDEGFGSTSRCGHNILLRPLAAVITSRLLFRADAAAFFSLRMMQSGVGTV